MTNACGSLDLHNRRADGVMRVDTPHSSMRPCIQCARQSAMECSVCLESIATLPFVAPDVGTGATTDAVDSADPTCVRLRCGHAFHAPCILATFRSGIGCPTCRDPLQLQAPGQSRRRAVLIHAGDAPGSAASAHMREDADDDGETMESSSEDDDGDSIDIPTVTRMDARLAVLRSTTPRIQAARRALNESLRAYRVLSDRLRHARRQALDAALREFRRSHLRTFDSAKRAVHGCLREVQEREREALLLTESEADVQVFMRLASHFEYRTNHVLESSDYTSVDPLRRHFWTRS